MASLFFIYTEISSIDTKWDQMEFIGSIYHYSVNDRVKWNTTHFHAVFP